jgi:hypothetical protein
MAILEMVKNKPDWRGALAVAMTRPPGVPERRKGEDPWNPDPQVKRPRRISDDLAWFRRAVDEPDQHGLQPLDPGVAVTVWESAGDEADEHLNRLRERGILDAAGFLLHEPELSEAELRTV